MLSGVARFDTSRRGNLSYRVLVGKVTEICNWAPSCLPFKNGIMPLLTKLVSIYIHIINNVSNGTKHIEKAILFQFYSKFW